MGSYDQEQVIPRFYQQIAYRVINPLLKTYHLSFERVLLHHEVSKEYDDCPGKLFEKTKFLAYMKNMIVAS